MTGLAVLIETETAEMIVNHDTLKLRRPTSAHL
jgi:hypothetical protein